MELRHYPRPKDDNGWGFHSSSGAYEKPWMSKAWRVRFSGKEDMGSLTAEDKAKVLQGYSRMLHDEYGIRWFKLLAADDSQIDFAKALTEAGIEVIVRTWKPEPHPGYVVPADVVRPYVDVGVHYIEWGNEPNLRGEWGEGEWGNGPQKTAKQVVKNFASVRSGGGIPLLPSMSPGGDYDHRRFYQDMLEALVDLGEIGFLEDAAVAIHNRPHNVPPDIEPSPSLTVTFREYEWIDDLITSYVGHSLPLLGTEAGYEIGDATVADFPRITGQTHAQYNMEILRGFKDKWRPCLFCQCMWLVELYEAGNFAFANAAWWYNKVCGGEYPDSILPAVHALRAEPKFVRLMPWEESIPLSLTIEWPAPGATLKARTVDVRGRVSVGWSLVTLRVNDVDEYRATADEAGTYAVTGVALVEGENRLSAVATSPTGDTTPTPVTVTVYVKPTDEEPLEDYEELRRECDTLAAELAEMRHRLDELQAKIDRLLER